MSQVRIKIQDIFHDEGAEYVASDLETYIENGLRTYHVADVRVHSGHSNTPLTITLERSVSGISFNTAKNIARVAVQHFSHRVDGVSTEETITDNNILVKR